MTKIFDLNLWNYNNFEERKPRIIEAIKQYNPDIIAFQEVRDDLRFNSRGYNQARQLNAKLGYKYFAFMKTMDVNKVNNRLQNPDCIEGIAVLSKYPITKVIRKKLAQHDNDRHTRGILYVNIKAKNDIEVCVVHFSPNRLFSKLHLEETLKYFKKNQLSPIIIGDFNIDDQCIITGLAAKDYGISTKVCACITLPETMRTIDFVLLPKKYKYKSFYCTGTDLSDHRALVAEVSLRPV